MQEGNKLTSKYCDARWCNTCNRIRTAKLINGYEQPLKEFKEMYFVTLTIPNVNRNDLKPCIVGMIRNLSNVIKARRRAGNGCNGIRKLECTYNANEDTFHPHFHLVIDGKENAEFIQREWLKRYPSASDKAQNLKPANIETAKELFKYVTKIVTKEKKDFRIYVPALDVIFQAMYKVRTFQSFGNVRMVSEEVKELDSDTYEQIPEYEFMVWVWRENDWFSMVTGEALTHYKPSEAMQKLVTELMVT
jgi:plasmid rolling circle replication initiator protein Rep